MTAEEPNRRLTTIVAADVAGYSRLTSIDEEGTLAALRKLRAEILDPMIAQHRGRIANTAGDSLLIEYPSVVEAVRCAMAIQTAISEYNQETPADRRVEYRIGVNIGDVVEQGGDLLGDGVNIAARLEGLAKPGGICLSRSAQEQIRDHLDLPLEDMGQIEVKNLPRPLHVFRIATEGPSGSPGGSIFFSPILRWGLAIAVIVTLAVGALWWWQGQERSAGSVEAGKTAVPRTDKPSIAVLPFAVMGGDKDQEYFADGMAEDIITDLSKISGLFVVARNSSFKFRGSAIDLKRVSRELGVRYVLEGSVRRSDKTIRINAQLIDTNTGGHLWADRYDGTLSDVFALQDEVTRQIVRALAVELNAVETQALNRAMLVNPEAYDEVLRGLEQMRRYARQTNIEARSHFERAVALAPNYARAHADLAVTYANDLLFGWTESREESGRKGLYHAERAQALDDRVREVHFASGIINLYLKRHEQALAATRRAVEIDPNYADAQGELGFILNYMGRADEGLVEIRKAMRLNPLYDFYYVWVLGQSYFGLGDYDKAAVAFEDVVERNAEFIVGQLMLAATYVKLGRVEDAKWAANEVIALLPDFSLAEERVRSPYKRPEDLERYITALSKAGLPD